VQAHPSLGKACEPGRILAHLLGLGTQTEQLRTDHFTSDGTLLMLCLDILSACDTATAGGGGHFTAPAADSNPNEFGAFNSLRDDGRPQTLQDRLASEQRRRASVHCAVTGCDWMQPFAGVNFLNAAVVLRNCPTPIAPPLELLMHSMHIRNLTCSRPEPLKHQQ
jgi:hypothetical protein